MIIIVVSLFNQMYSNRATGELYRCTMMCCHNLIKGIALETAVVPVFSVLKITWWLLLLRSCILVLTTDYTIYLTKIDDPRRMHPVDMDVYSSYGTWSTFWGVQGSVFILLLILYSLWDLYDWLLFVSSLSIIRWY